MEKDKKERVKESKEEDSSPHFVNTTNPKGEPWKTNIYFGQRDGISAHAHVALSGSAVLYFRDEQGKEIILNGDVVTKNTSQLLSGCKPEPSEEAQHPEQSPSENEDN